MIHISGAPSVKGFLAVFIPAFLFISPSVVLAQGDASAADEAYVNAIMVDDFLSTITGGALGLPGMDTVHEAMIVGKLLQGEYSEAASIAGDYIVSKAVTTLAGSSAGAVLAAVSLGESLGMAAHEFFGSRRLQALYDNLSRDTNPSGWPGSHAEAMNEDVGALFDLGVRPVALWLKANDGGRMSDHYYEVTAYRSLIAMRDFELGCDRYGLEGADRTPGKLQEALMDEIGLAAARARGAREGNLSCLEAIRSGIRADELEQQARALREEAAAAEEEEARRLAREAERLEREAEAALAAAAAAETAVSAVRRELEEIGGSDAFPAGPVPPSALEVSTLGSETLADDMTSFRVRITNTGSEPLMSFLPEVGAARMPPGGGVAWSGGQGPRTLGPGESVELSFVGTGDIGAVNLYLSARGQLLAVLDYPVGHSAREITEEQPQQSQSEDEDQHNETNDRAQVAGGFWELFEVDVFAYDDFEFSGETFSLCGRSGSVTGIIDIPGVAGQNVFRTTATWTEPPDIIVPGEHIGMTFEISLEQNSPDYDRKSHLQFNCTFDDSIAYETIMKPPLICVYSYRENENTVSTIRLLFQSPSEDEVARAQRAGEHVTGYMSVEFVTGEHFMGDRYTRQIYTDYTYCYRWIPADGADP